MSLSKKWYVIFIFIFCFDVAKGFLNTDCFQQVTTKNTMAMYNLDCPCIEIEIKELIC